MHEPYSFTTIFHIAGISNMYDHETNPACTLRNLRRAGGKENLQMCAESPSRVQAASWDELARNFHRMLYSV